MTEARSYVYFIAAGEDRIKIGRSVDPDARIKGLQTGSCEKLVLLGAVPGGVREEKALHRHFAAHRLEGEWFSFCDEIWNEVDRLLSGGTIQLIDEAPRKEKRNANPLLAEVGANITAYFKKLFPEGTASAVAAATGIKRDTIDRMMTRSSGMSARHLETCLYVFGPSFLAACCPAHLRPEWVVQAVERERSAAIDQRIADLEAARVAR